VSLHHLLHALILPTVGSAGPIPDRPSYTKTA
jgi:hypothetical protein